MIYIVKMDNPESPIDTGTPTRVRLIGPFEGKDPAAAWARSATNNPHDNPCWQLVDLNEPVIDLYRPDRTDPVGIALWGDPDP